MIEGSLKIGDEDYAIELLSKVHAGDPRRPVKELVENSADAGARSIVVVVNKRATDPYIMCRDDGNGMRRDALHKLPQNIANSIKRKMKEGTRGVHAIGLLGFKTIGDKLRIVTRAKGSADTNALEFDGLKRYKEIPVERPLDEQGTEVYIYGIDREKGLLNAQRLVEYLSEEFESDLLEGKFKLEVHQDGRKIPVTRERMATGTAIIEERKISTPFGDLVVRIYYGGKGGVALTRRGSTVVNTISSLPDLENDLWKSGKISGSISFDSLNVSADKKSPIRDDGFKALLGKIRELEPEIEKWVKEMEETESQKSKERLYRYLASRIDEVLKQLNFDRVRGLMEAGKKEAREVEAQEGKGAGFSRESGSSHKRVGKPPVSSGDRKRSVKSMYGINFQEEAFLEHPKQRSRFDAKFGTVYINKVHPDFARKVQKSKNEFEVLDYYYKLTVKEVVLHQFDGAPPSDVLERALDLQLAMEKSPPTL
jgi:hypothetical protein